MALADRIVVLNGGVIEQVGTPMELYQHARNLFVSGFTGAPKMNHLCGTVVRNGKMFAVDLGEFNFQLELATQVAEGQPITLGLRPEDVSYQRPSLQALCKASAVLREQLGSETLVYYRANQSDDMLIVISPGPLETLPGQETTLYAATSAVHVFDESGSRIV